MKKKIGTVVSETLYDDVKMLATRERRLISELVELALSDYVQRAKSRQSERVGLDRFMENDPLPVPTGRFNTVIGDPPY